MANLFYHVVGLSGSADFDKTVFKAIKIRTICGALESSLCDDIGPQLECLFPESSCNVWGVPLGARHVIAQMAPGDLVFLVRTIGVGGDIPALCQVDLFLPTPQHQLSEVLWGSSQFPYVFFFRTEPISLLWSDFKEHMAFAPSFRPPALFYRVAEERFWRWGSTEAYASFVRKQSSLQMQRNMQEMVRWQNLPAARGQSTKETSRSSHGRDAPELVDPTNISSLHHLPPSKQLLGDQPLGQDTAALHFVSDGKERTA